MVSSLVSFGEQTDPLACKLHPSEKIAFVSAFTRQPFCHYCIIPSNAEDLVPFDMHSIDIHLKQFRKLYEGFTTEDLENRSSYITALGNAMQGHEMRVVSELENSHKKAMADFDRQFNKYKSQVKTCFNYEKDKLFELGRVIGFLKEMSASGVKFDNITNHLNLQRLIMLAHSSTSFTDNGGMEKLKLLSRKLFSYKASTEINQINLEVPQAIIDLSMKLIESGNPLKIASEEKLSRFGMPISRWGVLEGRTQVEAVTFTVNQGISLVGIGLGCAFEEDNFTRCDILQICDGPKTNSPLLAEILNSPLPRNPSRSVRLNFLNPIDLQPDQDYTIRTIIRGEAGVYKGGATSRKITTPQGLTFKFKTSIYSEEDCINGDNADDGPILDLYYSRSSVQSEKEVQLSRFERLESQWAIRKGQIDAMTFELSRKATLTAVSLCTSASPLAPSILQSLHILLGNTTQSPLIAEIIGPIQVKPMGIDNSAKILLPSTPILEAFTKYTIKVQYKSLTPIYRGVGPFPVISVSGVNMKTEPAVYVGDVAFNDNSRDGPILGIYVVPAVLDKSNAINPLPLDFSEHIGGVACISRFESHEKHWSFDIAKQVECFSFNFSKPVLLTGISLGNSITRGTSYLLKSLRILMGTCSIGPVIYQSTKAVKVFNKDDSEPVVPIQFEYPVRIEAEASYTIRVVIRGNTKSYKGMNFKGSSITGFGDVTMRSSKSTLGGQDRRYGDNESGGPIFDFFYLTTNSNFDIDEFNKANQVMVPSVKVVEKGKILPIAPAVEHCYRRFASTGQPWHIKSDVKQIEAVSFKLSRGCMFIACGIGNAKEESKSTVVKSLTVLEGKSTKSPKIYKHSVKENLVYLGPDSRFVRVNFSEPVPLNPDTYYTLRVKYSEATGIERGTMPSNSGTIFGATIVFESALYEGGDVENGSHEIHGPLSDFYFLAY